MLGLLDEDDDGSVGALLHDAADEEERPVRVALARGDDEVVRRLLERVPALVEPVDDAGDLDLLGRGQRRLHDVAVDRGVDCDEGSDHCHRYLTGLAPSSRSAVIRPGRTGFAPVAGRSTSQIFPLSAA